MKPRAIVKLEEEHDPHDDYAIVARRVLVDGQCVATFANFMSVENQKQPYQIANSMYQHLADCAEKEHSAELERLGINEALFDELINMGRIIDQQSKLIDALAKRLDRVENAAQRMQEAA